MELIIKKIEGRRIAELKQEYKLQSSSDFMDLIGNASYLETYELIVYRHQLPSAFFDLKTGFAGEVLQKFSTNNLRLAIIGDFSDYKSNSLKGFIRESNRIRRVMFIETIESFLS